MIESAIKNSLQQEVAAGQSPELVFRISLIPSGKGSNFLDLCSFKIPCF